MFIEDPHTGLRGKLIAHALPLVRPSATVTMRLQMEGEQFSKTILLRRYAVVEYSVQFVPRVVVRLASS